MVFIFSDLYAQIFVPDGVEFAIYSNDYCDYLNGDDPESEYGDLVIETSNKRYKFTHVMHAFEYCSHLANKIMQQKENRIVYLDSAHVRDGDAFEYERFVVEMLSGKKDC